MAEIFGEPNEPAQGPPATPRATPTDLSRQIEQMVAREPVDKVRCVRVFGNFYRCNWWSRLGNRPDGLNYDWGGLMTDHVRQSRFFKATASGEDVVLEEVLPG